MARTKHSKSKRDGSRFVAIPLVVLDSVSYRLLSFSARSLLIEFAMQYNGINNGRLLLCDKLLRPRGWPSSTTIHKAKNELIQLGFVWETRKGHLPNKTSWFALTWIDLNSSLEMDVVAATFPRGAYLRNK